MAFARIFFPLILLALASPISGRANVTTCLKEKVNTALEGHETWVPSKSLFPENGYKRLPSGRKVFFDHKAPEIDASGEPKPTILLVHGLGEDLHSWGGPAEKLAAEGYGVIRLDLHGHGRTLTTDLESQRSLDWIDYKDNVEDLHGLVNAIGAKEVYLVGHSMGGGIVAEAAATSHPGYRIVGLNLNAAYTYRLDSARALMPQFSFMENMMSQFLPKAFLDMFTDPMLVDPLTSQSFRRYIERRFRQMNGLSEEQKLTGSQTKWIDEATRGAVGVMKGMREVDIDKIADRLPKIPITINMGLNDELVPNHMHEALFRSLKTLHYDVRLNAIKGVGHALPQDAGDQVTNSILDDLKKIENRSTRKASRQLLMDLDRDRYMARDPKYPGLVAEGQLHQGRLEYSFVMVREQDGARSPLLRGAEQFDKMMAHFGDRVLSIAGFWMNGSNLETFNELTAKGMDPKSAALSTWAGKSARRYGFTEVVIESLNGKPGDYLPVKVRFEKPKKAK